jgi:hypothetical protein
MGFKAPIDFKINKSAGNWPAHTTPISWSTQCLSVKILDAPYPSRAAQASRIWTPLDRPEQLKRPEQPKRPELEALLKVQQISNYTVYCTRSISSLQPAWNMRSLI